MFTHKNRKPTDVIRREQVKEALRSSLEDTIEARLDRYLEVDHQGIVANHHFAAASAQCIDLYRDGYFLSAVMVSQAVNEGICRFVLQRNGRKVPEKPTQGCLRKAITKLANDAVISQPLAHASERIWDSFRNDVHHMKPEVAQMCFRNLAKRNLQDLAIIEKEVFGVRIESGRLIPHHPQYWDLQPNGTVPAFLRLDF